MNAEISLEKVVLLNHCICLVSVSSFLAARHFILLFFFSIFTTSHFFRSFYHSEWQFFQFMEQYKFGSIGLSLWIGPFLWINRFNANFMIFWNRNDQLLAKNENFFLYSTDLGAICCRTAVISRSIAARMKNDQRFIVQFTFVDRVDQRVFIWIVRHVIWFLKKTRRTIIFCFCNNYFKGLF